MNALMQAVWNVSSSTANTGDVSDSLTSPAWQWVSQFANQELLPLKDCLQTGA